jgi:hypothetical protein
MTTALLAVPLWIIAAISIWNLTRSVRAERKYRKDVDQANELMRAGQELLRRHMTPATRTQDGETLH